MTPLQNLPKNVGDLGKLIVAKGFKKLPKVQKIAQSGHTVDDRPDRESNDKNKSSCLLTLSLSMFEYESRHLIILIFNSESCF